MKALDRGSEMMRFEEKSWTVIIELVESWILKDKKKKKYTK